jgi:thiol-disulfide isomerase/thioredoxin
MTDNRMDKRARKSSPKKRRAPSRLPQIFIIGGVILLAFVIIGFKKKPATQMIAGSGGLPQAQLEDALKAGKPALAFFHSDNCQQCIIMIETVDQVFPEFESQVELVDVNVYDPVNEPLMRSVRLQYIPTLVFYDRAGKYQSIVGVMSAEVLREKLSVLAGR